jgi:hypothetical protein
MGQYGGAAISATNLYRDGKAPSLIDAWKTAICAETKSEASRVKGCPKDAYLGLCEAGVVRGIPAGDYGGLCPNVNGRYALDAYKLLQAEPDLAYRKDVLWNRIPDRTAQNENCQLDVVLSLFADDMLSENAS